MRGHIRRRERNKPREREPKVEDKFRKKKFACVVNKKSQTSTGTSVSFLGERVPLKLSKRSPHASSGMRIGIVIFLSIDPRSLKSLN